MAPGVKDMKNRFPISCAIVIALLAFSFPACAFKCNINATGVSFGGYDVFASTPRDATGTINVDCNIPAQNPQGPLAVTVSISPGNSGTFTPRQMQGSGAVLNYNLYTSPSFSTIWGDGSGGSQVQSSMVNRDTPFSATIYGRIPARQNVTPGTYSDLLIVTVEW